MELRHYLRMLQRGWWIIALSALSALNIALIASYLATPLYRSSARFLVSPDAALASNSRDLVNSLQALDARTIISTYAEVLSSRRLFEETSAALQIKPEDLRPYTVKTVVLPEASILELTVEGPDPEMTALLANSIGQRAIDYIKGLYQVYNIDFLDQALVPSEAFQPQPLRDVSLGLAFGLVIGAALAILRELLRGPLEAVRQRSAVDPASSALTRRHLQHQLEEALAHNPSSPLSFALIHLDNFDELLESLPPAMTQRLLHYIVETLRGELRGHDSIGRWDESTFAVLLPSTPSSAAARTLERIRQALTRPIELDPEGDRLYLDPRVGAACAPVPAVTVAPGSTPAGVLLDQAQSALDRARLNGTKTVLAPVAER